MPVRWVQERADTQWDREASKLRAEPGVEHILDVESSNPSTHADRISRGDLAAFRPRRWFHARVVRGKILAYYLPPHSATGDDAP